MLKMFINKLRGLSPYIATGAAGAAVIYLTNRRQGKSFESFQRFTTWSVRTGSHVLLHDPLIGYIDPLKRGVVVYIPCWSLLHSLVSMKSGLIVAVKQQD